MLGKRVSLKEVIPWVGVTASDKLTWTSKSVRQTDIKCQKAIKMWTCSYRCNANNSFIIVLILSLIVNGYPTRQSHCVIVVVKVVMKQVHIIKLLVAEREKNTLL